MPFLMGESLSDTVVTYVVLKRLTKPWTEWEAYKLGIIDEKGKKLKTPISFDERAAWTVLDRFIWNLKKIMEKFVGGTKLASYLTATYLLRDNIRPHILMKVKDGADLGCLSEMTYAKQEMLFKIDQLLSKEFKEMKMSNHVLNESDEHFVAHLGISHAMKVVEEAVRSVGDADKLFEELTK